MECLFCNGISRIASAYKKLVKCNFCDNMLCEKHAELALRWGKKYYPDEDNIYMCNDCVIWNFL